MRPPSLSAPVGRCNCRIPTETTQLLCLELAKMVGQSCYELFQRDLKSLADSQQREHGDRAASFNHLPVTDTESVGNHVLLAEFPFCSVGPNSVTQGTEKPCIAGRQLSASTHHSKLRRERAKVPRTKIRLDDSNPTFAGCIIRWVLNDR